MNTSPEERLKEWYRLADEFVKAEHPGEVKWSHECRAALSISASVLACKLFDIEQDRLARE